MKFGKLTAALLFITSSATLQAQPASDSHPWITDRFAIEAGVFFPTSGFKISADGTSPGRQVDFNGALGVDKSQSTGSLTFRWNFGEKWSVWGQWWALDPSGSRTLDEDITWRDLTFQSGSDVTSGVDVAVGRLFFGREFSNGDHHEFGAGFGLHWLDLEAYIEGEVFINDQSSGFRRESVDAAAPLPNIGAWYYFSPAQKWLLQARIDWFSANIGDYDGTLINGSIGANFQLTDHFGLGLSYQYFDLDVDVDSGNWEGGADISTRGLFFALTANW